jgi:tetratricopeptide (TPR) repeat protein
LQFLCALVLSQGLVCSNALSAELKPLEEAAEAYEQAMRALGKGEQERAELLLERVLMLSPDNAEARLELAALFAKRGRVVSARLMLESLELDPRTPIEHKQNLRRLIAQLQGASSYSENTTELPNAISAATRQAPRAPQITPAASTQLELGLTHSSNPLARTASEGITFTMPEGPVLLPLSVKPTRGLSRTFQLSHEPTQFQNAGAELYLQSLAPGSEQNATAQTSSNFQNQTAARLSVWGGIKPLTGLPKLSPLLIPLQWHYQAQQGLDGLRRQSLSLAYPFDYAGLAWRGVAVHYQEPTAPERQGDRGQAIRLEQRGVSGTLSWLLHAEKSTSQVFEQGYVRAGVFAELLPMPKLLPQTRLSMQISEQRDTHSYSPLLLNGAKRQLFSSLVAIEQQVKFEKEKVLIFRVFSAERRSNLELFNYKDTGIQLSLRQQL